MSLKIGVSGLEGSFSEEAANYYCHKEKIKDYQLAYLISAENVLQALDKGEIDRGVFPIENSNGGIVYEAVYAMSKHIFNILKIFEIDVRHCLMAKKGVNTADIKKIASHDQALKQCRMYLKRKWPDVEMVQWEDTAKAAKDLSEGKISPDTAVIAPKRAAELYGLDVLEEGVQDLKFNFTTFLFVSKK
jgi:prephenate dehydratase